ncbi:MerR family transcriptional regulator [Streptomyces sulfonofaciens]|uniref:MerR family transcriptional regulator n=1 Tax=Streptomyces sulfonofaciens TaxID=68272 RepID=UPI001675D689|nr:MerR family transcriptional regulator [Streptomyces sulfonofaciens]
MLTIGVFARAARLSPKALRLYDELGLLRPARVDTATGYRYYAVGQLEQARLVAWLRRLGMPLERIRRVCAAGSAAAAHEVAAFWADVEADTAARRALASFLVEELSRKDTVMTRDPDLPVPAAPLRLSYAALTDTGLIRPDNQDAVYAGSRVLAVADGFGPGGAPASSAAVAALGALEDTARSVPAGQVLNLLDDAVRDAARAVREAAGAGAAPDEQGTTLTALVWTGSELALVHIGDCRAYLLRDGGLFRITTDDTLVQSMVDEGRLTPAEAAAHPQRSLLLKALTAGAAHVPRVWLRQAGAGDRYVLCSDGVTTALPEGELRDVVAAAATPEDATRDLVGRVRAAGAPDNVSCVVADVEPAAA